MIENKEPDIHGLTTEMVITDRHRNIEEMVMGKGHARNIKWVQTRAKAGEGGSLKPLGQPIAQAYTRIACWYGET